MERVRVFRTDHEPTEAEVFRVVNVEECPELRDAALEGTLHRLDDGDLIDVPFIYHDPGAQQFVLVIPHGARGRELAERAKLLDSLMKEQEQDVPDYVRHFAIVHGRHGLSRYVEDTTPMEVETAELEPVDGPPHVASHDPRLASLLPPAGSWSQASTELTPMIDEDELWIFVQVVAAEQEAFAESNSDLLIQLKTVHQLPICVLALTDAQTGAVRRAYLNATCFSDGRILELLQRDCRATIVVYNERRHLLRCFHLEAPRAANAKMIIERAELAPRAPPERWEEAVQACRAMPPPVGHVEHPFLLQDEATSVAEALRRLKHLEDWSSPERIQNALTVVSVPKPVFELSRRQIVADALRFGLAMSDELVLQAVRFGLATDAKGLVAALGRQFDQTVSFASAQGLDDRQIQANRAALDRLSQIYGTSTRP